MWHNTIRQPHRQRLLRANRASRENQVERAAQADQSWQAYRPTVDQRDAPAPAEDAERRVLLHYAQIAPEGKLHSTGDGVARDRGNHRLGEQHACWPHWPVTFRLHAVEVSRCKSFEVSPSAEVAMVAIEHTNRRVRIGVERAKRLD